MANYQNKGQPRSADDYFKDQEDYAILEAGMVQGVGRDVALAENMEKALRLGEWKVSIQHEL